MKFQQLSALEKHLEKSAPDHLARVYLVVAACPFDRRKIYEMICSAWQKKQNKLALLHFEGKETDWARVQGELDTASFLNGYRVVVIDEIDKLKKAALEALPSYVSKPSPFAYLLLGASSAKNLTEIYTLGKKELIVCDLSAEKPWERKDRLKSTVLKNVQREGKTIAPEALERLMERTGADASLLQQELEKLACYCGERQQITLQDVQAIGTGEKTISPWQLAESILWEARPGAIDATFELSSFLILLGQVRSHAQQGLQLALSLKQKKAIDLPFFKPQLLQKAVPIARHRGEHFFQGALRALFEMEMLAKNSSFSPHLLFDLLIAKLDHLKHAIPAA